MLRFALSPHGDMHIGDLQVAVVNHILSKQSNEDLLIRIDDMDKERNIEGKEKEILEILSLFSIDHKSVIYQSENLKYHQKMAMQLMSQKKAFACFCSDNKLDELKEEAKAKSIPYSYDGFCATLSDETVLNCNAPFTVRIQKPQTAISFNDALQGDFEYSPEDVDSFVILKHDKTPTCDYASAVDDMLYNISTIVRTEQYTSNTPKQIHVRHSLGYDKVINYTHIPLIENGDISVKKLIDEGFLPSAIANYLVLLSNNTPLEVFTLEEATQWFDIKNTPKNTATFDRERLKTLNTKHLELMDELRLSKILGFADSDIGALAKLFLGEASTISELKANISPIFEPKNVCEGFEEEIKAIISCLQTSEFMEDFKDLEKYIMDETHLKGDNLLKPLRYVLTGKNDGPNLNDIYPLIKNYLGEIVK